MADIEENIIVKSIHRELTSETKNKLIINLTF